MALQESGSVEDGTGRHPRPAADHAHKSETRSETLARPAVDGDAADLGLLGSAAMVSFCITSNLQRLRSDSASRTASGRRKAGVDIERI